MSDDSARGAARILGVAIAVPDPFGTELTAMRERLGDPDWRTIPTHVTLLPPTTVDDVLLPEIHDHLAAAAAKTEPFRIRLRGSGTFRPVSPVVFVRVQEGGAACDRLQRVVRTGPLSRDLTFPFHPHVTVAHHLDDDALDRAAKEMAAFSAAFDVVDFVLYEHGTDGVWRPRRRFGFDPTS